jgi:hypothetical protein
VFGIIAFGGVQTAWADVVYSFTTIDVPGAANTQAYGINDSGQIVGTITQGSAGYCFLDSGGTFTFFEIPISRPVTQSVQYGPA